MASFDEVAELIRTMYASVWSEWYRGRAGVPRATLRVEPGCLTSGYDPKTDTVWIYVAEGNLEDHDIADPEAWPIWRIELIEEMLHEYQYKMVRTPSAVGRRLFEQHNRRFSDRGHGDDFFTAIAECSSSLGMSPEQLIDALCGLNFPGGS